MILNYLAEIEKALDAKLYIMALSSTLALPDICACLESANPAATGNVKQRYIDWYKNNAEKYCYLSADLCYKYRCSMIHSNRGKIDDACEKIAFFLPPVQCVMNACELQITCRDSQGNDVTDRAITIDYETFVYGMIKAVKEWRMSVLQNPNYIANSKDLLQIRPLSPLNMINGDLVVY